MAIRGSREIIGGSYQQRLGDPGPTLQKRFIVSTDGFAPSPAAVIREIGYDIGDSTDEGVVKAIDIQDQDKYRIEVTVTFEPPDPTDFDPENPEATPDSWSFQFGSGERAITECYAGQGNNNKEPLDNAAREIYAGIMGPEPEVRIVISGLRPSFPLDAALAVTGHVNNTDFLGAPKHQFLCAGVSGNPVGDAYEFQATLIWRASGHNLFLPNVGYNFLEDGILKRAYVFDDDGNKVPTASPVALDLNGRLLPPNTEPLVLQFRIYPETNFSFYFGNPPANVTF
jgi:hypothetical protein